LKKLGLNVVAQHPIQVYYDKAIVGDYFADILVENTVIIEIKAAKTIIIEHEAQLLNYLKATQLEVGLLLNFGQRRNSAEKHSIIQERSDTFEVSALSAFIRVP